MLTLAVLVAAFACCAAFVARAQAATTTIFGSATPPTLDSKDPNAVVLGVKFSSEVAGRVTGVRFYKTSTNTGTHIGSLWSSGGTLLASATFTGESASGWQQVSFSTPVTITPNTTYVASYLAPKGHYSETLSGFATAGVSNPPLKALANSVSADGVYVYGATNKFPTNTYKSTNYWVDVVFEATPTTPPGQVTNVTAQPGLNAATVSWSAPASGGEPTEYKVTPYIAGEAQASTTVSGSPPATSTTVTGLKGGTAYTFTVQALNSAGPGPVSAQSLPVTPTAPTAPEAPTQVSATAGNASASVKWSAPGNGGSTILSYTITPYAGTEALTATVVKGTPPATTALIEGLKNGTTYTFKVTATNQIGTGPESLPSNPVTPATEPIALPDLQSVIPTADIYIVSAEEKRTLEFEHITSDLGAGPLEMRPTYNKATGISQGYQALYTMPTPGAWKFAYTVPIVGPMYWVGGGDYRFPFDRFALYGSNEGQIGSVAATSPKELYCMTSDTFVGGVPNAPATNGYPSSNCLRAEGVLGMSVGWGDEYDATDGGEGIDITSLPNGVYWLRAEADPDHYFQESNTSNNVTDTKLMIEGTSVKVLEQTHPTLTPPSVTFTAPKAESTISGTSALSAEASGPSPIDSVQFLLDGQPIGAPVTSPPYTLNWTPGSGVSGKHFLSAQVTDSRSLLGTAADVPVTIQETTGGGGGETPGISLVNPTAGQIVSDTIQVAATAHDEAAIEKVQFYLDGKPLGAALTAPPWAISWNTKEATNANHTLGVTMTDAMGRIVSSTNVTVKVENPAEESPCFVMDANTTVNGRGTVTTPLFTTAEAGEQLFAFVSTDGPAGAGRQTATVSGAGLVWTLVKRANSRAGDAEIWTATAIGPLSGVSVSSTPAVGGFDQTLTVISMQMSQGAGASAGAGAASGEATVSLKTTEEGSLVFAVGHDWSKAAARTLGAGQVMLHQFLDTGTGDTTWTQYTGAVTGAAGETVTINDTAPTKDEWDLAAVEVRPDID